MRNIFISLSTLAVCAAALSCGSTETSAGAFEYRDIYLPDYTAEDNQRLNLDLVDNSWGIWGHNLSTVLPDNPSRNIYAEVPGGRDDDQFCFSSEDLFDYICDYIRDNYLFQKGVKFAILPNDNNLVCLCSECVAVGNTKGDASPAVYNMIERLAKKYPEHQFFTSHYLTTSHTPDKKLPDNAGVIISAIDFPLASVETPKEREFIDLINSWQGKADKVYIWDYVNNFDDYFTPSPIFGVAERRLRLYRDLGVDGVFFNGSGNDYSTMGRLKKEVLAQMMENPDIDWKELVKDYTGKHFPIAGEDISAFIITQEEMLRNNGKSVPLYEGVTTALTTYLPEKEFVDFYNKIVAHKKNATGAERDELELMTDAMALTMLELKRIQSDTTHTGKLRERLGRLPGKGITVYNEGCWSIEDYLAEYDSIENVARETGDSNLLRGVQLRPLTNLDEDYTDISIITDGMLGIPSNYHDGNLISSADPALRIEIPHQPGMKRLRVWLVNNPAFKIFLPEQVYITVGDIRSKAQFPEAVPGQGHVYLDFDVPGGGPIELTLRKSPDAKTMAIDEIQGFAQ